MKLFIIMILSIFESEFSENFNVMFLFFEISRLQFSEKFKHVKVLIEKDSESNKRIHMNFDVSILSSKKQFFQLKQNF